MKYLTAIFALPALRHSFKLLKNESSTFCCSNLLFNQYRNLSKTSSVLFSSSYTQNNMDFRENIPSDDDDFVEKVVCKVDDLKDDEMRVFDMSEDGKVLLVKQNGLFSALGTKCTHYGAPLVNGVLGYNRIRCQWHGACFNTCNGDIEEFPGLDSLPCHKVTIVSNEVKVRARKSDLRKDSRMKTLARHDPNNNEKFVVIGGGPAAQTCVETLRQEGFVGKITMVAKEGVYPYDRVKVSKTIDSDPIKLQLRPPEFYKDTDIEVLKCVEATGVNTAQKSVSLSNGSVVAYDKLFIATGSKARKLPVPGNDLKNVITIRTVADGNYLSSQLGADKDVVIAGSSFIAMETATACVGKAKSVTVIGRDTVPFKHTLGPEVGAAIMKLFESKGIKFIMNANLKSCDDNGKGAVKSVTLQDGSVIPADICIMGTGSTFYTDFLKNSGIELRPDGSIEADQFMRTKDGNVFVGGDIAFAPISSHNHEKTTIGHYSLAHLHGHIAAKNMLDKEKPLRVVPYFWTMLFGKSFRYAGHGQFDEIIYHGNVEELKFVAFYLKDEKVVAICSCQMDPVVSQYAERATHGKKLTKKEIQGANPLEWVKDI